MAITAEREQAYNQQWLQAADAMAQQADAAPSACGAVWHYTAPALILGRSQARQLDALRATDPGLEIVVRGSGGTAVLAGPWMVAASVAIPDTHPLHSAKVVDGYRWFAQAHLATLAHFGINAVALDPGLGPIPDPVIALDWACFGGLSAWEITADHGRKLVGLAQRRGRRSTLLVAGTLVGPSPWEMLAKPMGHPESAQALARTTVCCDELAAHPIEPADFAVQLARELRRYSQGLSL